MSEETYKKEHDEKHLEKLTIKELREIAAEIPHEKAVHKMKKEELIAFIKEARGIKDETPVKKKKYIGKIKMTKPELKAKIRELKALRLQVLESKESEKALRLRHQISQLKKNQDALPRPELRNRRKRIVKILQLHSPAKSLCRTARPVQVIGRVFS
jgi:excinuclease UvrABC helicase subunit UvrB